MRNTHAQSISELSQLFRKRELSPVAVMQSLLEELEEREPVLHAFITVLKTEALRQAAEAERRFQAGGELPPLLGIPFSVKDLFCTKGVKTTCGSRILREFLPEETSPLIRRLEAAGAILFGKTNMLEFAYGAVHPDYGQCGNPWNPAKTSGGSSSGSAASVAAGIGSFSLGTDTGGSIRIPASYCGIVGLKPTHGALCTDHLFPLSWSLDHAGVLSRTVAEAALVWDCLTGETTVLPKAAAPLRIGILPEVYHAVLTPDVRRVYENVLQTVRALGWEVTVLPLADLQAAEEVLMDIVLPEAAYIHREWLDREADYAPVTYRQLQLGRERSALSYIRAMEEAEVWRHRVDGYLQEVDFVLMPTVAYPAPEEDPALEDGNEMLFTALWNVTGHPAVTVPAGFSGDGLPIGMQLAGGWQRERELLQAAYWLEQSLRR